MKEREGKRVCQQLQAGKTKVHTFIRQFCRHKVIKIAYACSGQDVREGGGEAATGAGEGAGSACAARGRLLAA